MVLDQTLKHNSSISFVNTNVWREGTDYDANVSAGLFELNDKKNTWNLGGKLAVSNRFNYLPEDKTKPVLVTNCISVKQVAASILMFHRKEPIQIQQ